VSPHARKRCLRKRMEVKVETYGGRGGIFVSVDLVGVQGEDRDLIMMRLVALGRARAAIAGRAEIGPTLYRALRRRVSLGITPALRQTGHVGGDIKDHPVPIAAAGRRVRIVNGERKTLRAFGDI